VLLLQHTLGICHCKMVPKGAVDAHSTSKACFAKLMPGIAVATCMVPGE
jgi:hypothetical protein